MWVKICANTNLEDTLLAVEFGADAVGFVFAPSSRQVTPAQVAAIVEKLPAGVEKVGVFPAWSSEQIIETVEQAGLTTVQLHGTPDPGLARKLHAHFTSKVTIIQVVHWNLDAQTGQSEQIAQQLVQLAAMPQIARILIDTKVDSTIGGTGVAFPWQQAATTFTAHPKIILAGGLNPNSVGEAIHLLKPWGVDVASGVETSLGKKDPAKLEAFIEAARNAMA